MSTGSCYSIRLSNGQFAYAQLLAMSMKPPPTHALGAMVSIFDLLTDEELVNTSRLSSVAPRFLPIYVGLKAMLKSGRWRRIGELPVPAVGEPIFRSSLGLDPRASSRWRILERDQERVVDTLALEERDLEVWKVWGYEDLERRVLSGVNPDMERL